MARSASRVITVPPAKATNKPLLRGVSHEIGFFVALAATVALLLRARGGVALAAAAIYGTSLCTLLGVSALYHRRTWQGVARERMRRVDHSAIFVLIAGTFTPFCLLMPEGRALALSLVWLVAALGVLRAILWPKAPKPLVAALAVAFGCSAVPIFGHVRARAGQDALALIVAGGVLYIIGAVIYALRRPNPSPRVFGYHEIFHALVLAASVCHYSAMTEVVRALAG